MNPLALPLALLLGQAGPASPAQDPVPPPSLRELRLTRLPGDRFRATLGGEPVEGADFYRAVLRPDLAERLEGRDRARTTALVVAGAAAVGGPALGWLAFRAQGRSVQPCILPGASSGCEALNAQVRRDNRALGERGLLVGGAVGAAAAGLALWWWADHPALAPGLGEAEALVEAYEARRRGAGAPRPARPGGAETGLRLRLEPVAGGLLAAAEWRR